MSKIKDFIKTHKYILLLLYWPFHGIWYLVLQDITMGRDPVAIVSSLDFIIPFCEWMIIPYVLWYPQLITTLLYTVIKNPKGFIRAAVMIMGGCLVCMVICTVFPMYFERQGMPMLQNDNMLTSAVKALQGFDPPTTVLPSMHVYVSLACHVVLCKDPWARRNRLLIGSSALLSVAISLSTVTIKQHSIIDVAAAVVLVGIMYFVAYTPKYERLMKLADKK